MLIGAIVQWWRVGIRICWLWHHLAVAASVGGRESLLITRCAATPQQKQSWNAVILSLRIGKILLQYQCAKSQLFCTRHTQNTFWVEFANYPKIRPEYPACRSGRVPGYPTITCFLHILKKLKCISSLHETIKLLIDQVKLMGFILT